MATIRNRPRKPAQRTLVVGAGGGVGSALLGLLEGHAVGRPLVEGTSELLLLDRDPPRPDSIPSGLVGRARWLEPLEIREPSELAELIERHRITEVIELAALGTWDCVEVCADHGASYLNTCYDHWDRSGPAMQSMIRARELFDPPDVDAGVHVIGAGMNPGLVNLLVGAALRELGERTGRPPSLQALEIHTIAITELDRTQASVENIDELSSRPDFACTWCPEHCLEELLEPEAMIVIDGELVGLGHPPHRADYRARCGDRSIVGHMVPHEELVTLSAMYPGVELGYVYALPELAARALAASPERTPGQWPVRRLYPPDTTELTGFDRIGVLVCSRSLGELWVGWHTDVATALEYGTNATLLQVATGLIAGWTSLRQLEPGIWLPEDLDGPELVALASRVLGPLDVVYAADAPAIGLRERRL